MEPVIGEIWRVKGLWQFEELALVRIMEVLESGSVDVNYQLNPMLDSDCRILPKACLVERVMP